MLSYKYQHIAFKSHIFLKMDHIKILYPSLNVPQLRNAQTVTGLKEKP